MFMHTSSPGDIILVKKKARYLLNKALFYGKLTFDKHVQHIGIEVEKTNKLSLKLKNEKF